MFATCVWLLWVLAQQIGIDAMALVLGGCACGAGRLGFGLAQTGAKRWRWVALVAAPLALYGVFAMTLPARAGARRTRSFGRCRRLAAWNRSAEEALLAAGKPVFIDFTPPGASPARPTSGWC